MTDAVREVRVIGTPVPYADGSEAYLRDVLDAARDRSAGSDDLAAAIRDWPSNYHFSPLRVNLVRPLEITPGTRVLDVGAGSGALARYFGERGAEVVGLEGSLERAQVAAERCRDLDNVEIVCGQPHDLVDEGAEFDLVVAVGVLEYAGAGIGGGRGAAEFLKNLRALTAPQGALVLAIENQLGLKYLLSHTEDHRGEPWVGITGYQGPSGPRTYSRAVLRDMLGGAGFAAQRWLFPFPDYKLPTVVVSERAYDEPDAGSFVDQIVRAPAAPNGTEPQLELDERAAHAVFLSAGLGPDVANSFLIIAGAERASLDARVEPDALAWLFGGRRRRRWRRRKLVQRVDNRRVVQEVADSDGGEGDTGWLSQAAPETRDYVAGETVEQLARRAVATHDREALRKTLHHWWTTATEAAPPTDPGGSPEHPFADPTPRLPADMLDIGLANFVSTENDALVRIDTEWRAAGGVSGPIAGVRALWYFALDVMAGGSSHPWPPDTTVDQLTLHLADMAGIEADDDLLERWKAAEAELQEVVTGEPRHELLTAYRTDGQRTSPGPEHRPSPEAADALQRELDEARAAADRLDELRRTLPFRVYRGLRELTGRLRRSP